jgi:UDP-glucose 4-epimerase
MRVLVTGGAGYIGSVIVEELLLAGHSVIVYDNLSKGHRASIAEDAIFIHGELFDEALLRATLIDGKVEAVIHMAADSLVGESVQHPAKYYQNNLIAGLALLNAMRSAEVNRFVFSSTAAVYGEPEKQPIEETHATVPTNPYGETKLAFERVLKWYEQAYGLRHVSLRYFNAAGATKQCGEAHSPETHLIPILLEVAAGHRPHVEIYGNDYSTRDGTCVRDYIHVVDLAAAHIQALNILDGKSATYNLGCGNEGYTVNEVIECARSVTGRKIPTEVVARRPGDPATLVASSELIRAEFGWVPRFQDLPTIIGTAWSWLQSHPNGYDE